MKKVFNRNSIFVKCIYLLVFLIVFSNCSIKKRSYRKGYYVEWVKISKRTTDIPIQNQPILESKTQKKAKEISPNATLHIESKPQNILSSVDKKGDLNFIVNEVRDFKIEDSCKDIVIMRNGAEFRGKVKEASSKYVVYYNCEKSESLTVPSKEVFMVTFENGTKNIYNVFVEEKEPNDFAFISLVCAAFFFLGVTSILGIVSGIIGLVQINHEPEKYSGKAQAILGIVLNSMIMIAFLTLFLIAILA